MFHSSAVTPKSVIGHVSFRYNAAPVRRMRVGRLADSELARPHHQLRDCAFVDVCMWIHRTFNCLTHIHIIALKLKAALKDEMHSFSSSAHCLGTNVTPSTFWTTIKINKNIKKSHLIKSCTCIICCMSTDGANQRVSVIFSFFFSYFDAAHSVIFVFTKLCF